jgi:hypothetical protein
MRRLTILLFATVLLYLPAHADDIESQSGDPFGPGFVPGILCDECRDPNEYPMDFVAFAYNGFFGDEHWMFGSKISWPFRIYNLNGDWVNTWFEDVIFYTPSLLPRLLTVMIRFENGQVVAFKVRMGESSLPIGNQDPEPEPGPGSCSCGGEGGDDDEYDDPDEYEWPEPEPTGNVEIVDADEDGEFPPFWEEEL